MLVYLVQRFTIFVNRDDNQITLEIEKADFDELGNVTIGDEFLFMFQIMGANSKPVDISEDSEFRQHFRLVQHDVRADWTRTEVFSEAF